MLLINLDYKSQVPLFRQVFSQIKELIDNDALKPGEILPPSRIFSRQLGVHRTTIYKAYEELWALGYIDSRPGSYTKVRKPAGILKRKIKKKEEILDWDKIMAIDVDYLADHNKYQIEKSDEDTISFLPLAPDPRLMPIDEFRKCMNRVLMREASKLLQYSEPMGYKPLREFIADRMRHHGISVSIDEIMITNGAQNALDLILKLLVKPGRKIITEVPTYSWAIPLFRYYGCEIISISLREDGIDLDLLEQAIRTHHPAFVYTMPNFHNPTGITTDQAHRERLIEICEKNLIPLVEDGFEEEMKYFGKAILPIKAMDQNDIVVYLGTFSKILFPGVRIGWIIANAGCIRRLRMIKQISEISANVLNQAALHLFCVSGHYDLHIKRMHRVYRKRMILAIKMIKEYFPVNRLNYTKPSGGYTIWITMKNTGRTDEEIFEHIRKHKALILPGSMFFPAATDSASFRISIAQLDEQEIEEGMKRIGKALNDLF